MVDSKARICIGGGSVIAAPAGDIDEGNADPIVSRNGNILSRLPANGLSGPVTRFTRAAPLK
jgi:hypothetical protein